MKSLWVMILFAGQLALSAGAADGRRAYPLNASSSAAGCAGQLGALVQKKFPSLEDLRAALKAGDASAFHDLAAYALVREVGDAGFNAILAKPDGPEFLAALLGDQEWLEDFLCSGPPRGDFPTSLRTLWLFWHYEKAVVQEKPLYRKMATAFALGNGATTDYNAVTSFRLYVKNHKELKMHAKFDSLSVHAMRFATAFGDPADIVYHTREWHLPLGAYYGTVWYVPYRGECDFGDNIQGGGVGYHTPWRWRIGYQENSRYNGGVCGTCSTYGAYSGRPHGIPEQTVGQPGHCAYVLRQWDGIWGVGNAVTWPTSGYAFWSGQYTFFFLIEDIYSKNAAKALLAQRAAWYAEWRRDQAEPRAACVGPWRCSVYAIPKFPEAGDRPVREETLPAFGLGDKLAVNGQSATVYAGEIEIPVAGDYLVSLASDDGSRIFIDNREAAAGNAPKTLALAKGRHACRLEHFDSGGGFFLNASIKIPAAFRPEVADAYRLALAILPIHYGIARDYQGYLVETKAPLEDRKQFLQTVAKGYVQHQEAAWTLLTDARLYDGIAPGHRLKALASFNRILQETKVQRFENYTFNGYVGAMAGLLDKKDHLGFFADMLAFHQQDPNYLNWILEWANGRFAGDRELSDDYVAILARTFGASANPAHRSQFSTMLQKALVQAAKDENFPTYQRLTALSRSFFEKEILDPGTRYLNADLAKKMPRVPAFPGKLLSAPGLLTSSSDSGATKPLLHPDLLGNPLRGGFVQTGAEEHPWVKVAMPCETAMALSGIVIVTRWELKAERDNSFPMLVSVSPDGKAWQPVQTVEEPQDVVCIDLTRRSVRGKYVKVESDRTKKPAVLPLRNLLVFGTP